MSELHEELLAIADRLEQLGQAAEAPAVKVPLDELHKRATDVGKAWSGSWLGYHARIYYEGLTPPPPGDHFSQEWGMEESWPIRATTGDWREFAAEDVETAIRHNAGDPKLERAHEVARAAREGFENEKAEVLSLLTTALAERPDTFLSGIQEQVEKSTGLSKGQVLLRWQPSGQVMSRDSLAITQGFHTPPHLSVLAEVESLRQPGAACLRLAQLARKAGSHLARMSKHAKRSQVVGTNVFIGHGRSPVWRELKDFVQDRLQLPWDEFNRIPVAGVTNIARLSEMLDAAAIAFLIMTGEDEQADGKVHARMNVVHEAGLFQGRLSFTRAIVLLEDGCEEFSNIHGLGQIRFPRGNIRAVFDEVRQVLEREGLLPSPETHDV